MKLTVLGRYVGVFGLLPPACSLSLSFFTPTPPFRQTCDDDLNDNIAKQAAIFICNMHMYVDIFRQTISSAFGSFLHINAKGKPI